MAPDQRAAVTPSQAQELADLIDELARERASEAVDREADRDESPSYAKAKLVKLLESIHAG